MRTVALAVLPIFSYSDGMDAASLQGAGGQFLGAAEKLAYYVFFPALLFNDIDRRSPLTAGGAWRACPLRRRGGGARRRFWRTDGLAFTSYLGTIRPNTISASPWPRRWATACR